MTRKPVAVTRFAVSGFMFRLTVLRSVVNVLPLSSVAMPSTSRSFLNIPPASVNGSALPLTKVEITTEPLGAGPLNTTAVTRQRQSGQRQRALHRVLQFRRRAVLGGGARFRRLAARRDVALARADHVAGLVAQPHLDLAEAAVAPVVGRVVAHHVVGAVVVDDPLEGGAEVVLVDDREAAGLLAHDAQAVLRQADFVEDRPHAEAERGVVGERLDRAPCPRTPRPGRAGRRRRSRRWHASRRRSCRASRRSPSALR